MLGQIIKNARLAAGLTQKKLGLLCGYPESAAERTVQYWEAEEREPPLGRLRLLAKALKLPVEKLIP